MTDFRQALRQVDLKPFLQRSDALAWWSVLVNYLLIAAAFVIVGIWPNVFTVLVALVLLGNRQLGLGILMHDCAHNALFKSKRLNQWVGELLCAGPILAQFDGYRRYHLKHHAKAGTDGDPDYPNYRHYPVSKGSLARKFARDLFGLTGLKNFGILLAMHAGVVEYDMAYKNTQTARIGIGAQCRNLARNLAPALGFHGVLVGVLWLVQALPLYALWWGAYLTTFMLFSRIRNAAEHAGVPNLLDPDPRLHARTVYASWLARLTVAPNHVNYHLEHHWMPGVPPYRLAGFHHALKAAGILDNTRIVPSYSAVLGELIKPTAPAR